MRLEKRVSGLSTIDDLEVSQRYARRARVWLVSAFLANDGDAVIEIPELEVCLRKGGFKNTLVDAVLLLIDADVVVEGVLIDLRRIPRVCNEADQIRSRDCCNETFHATVASLEILFVDEGELAINATILSLKQLIDDFLLVEVVDFDE